MSNQYKKISVLVEPLLSVDRWIYGFNRGDFGPLRPVAKALERFADAPKKTRWIVIGLGMALLVAKCLLVLLPYIKTFVEKLFPNPEMFDIAYTLVHFDFLLYTALVMAALFALTLFWAKFHNEQASFYSFRGHPFLFFLIAFPALLLIIVYLPLLIGYGFDSQGLKNPGVPDKYFVDETLGYSQTFEPGSYETDLGKTLHRYISPITPPKNFLPNVRYLYVSIFTALCLAIYFADGLVKTGAVRWWLLPFIFIWEDFPLALAWFCAFSGLLPSKAWRTWRPFLAGATCLLPLLSIVVSQPLLATHPEFGNPQSYRLSTQTDYYQGVQLTDPSKLILGFEETCTAMSRNSDRWTADKIIPSSYVPHYGSYDRERNLFYLYDFMKLEVGILDVTNLFWKTPFLVPKDDFGANQEMIHQVYDSTRGILVIAHGDGKFVSLNVDPFKVRNSTVLSSNLHVMILSMTCDTAKGELLVLTQRELIVLDIETLKEIRKTVLPNKGMDMYFDQEKNQIYISLPVLMKVVILDGDDFSVVEFIDAPLGARTIAMDRKRNLLFFAAITGVIEVRDLSTHQLLGRARISPWIHRLEIMPEYGEMVVTSHIYPKLWRYDPLVEPWDFGDQVLRLLETCARPVLYRLMDNN